MQIAEIFADCAVGADTGALGRCADAIGNFRGPLRFIEAHCRPCRCGGGRLRIAGKGMQGSAGRILGPQGMCILESGAQIVEIERQVGAGAGEAGAIQ
jgi:hypothetical protein